MVAKYIPRSNLIVHGWAPIIICVRRDAIMNNVDLSLRCDLTIHGEVSWFPIMQGGHSVNGVDLMQKFGMNKDKLNWNYIQIMLTSFVFSY